MSKNEVILKKKNCMYLWLVGLIISIMEFIVSNGIMGIIGAFGLFLVSIIVIVYELITIKSLKK